MRIARRPRVEAEPRPPVARGLGPWWIPAVGVLAALALMTGHLRRGSVLLGVALLVAAALRVVLPQERCGGLVVRGRGVDVAVLVTLAALVVLSGLTLDLRPG